MATINQAMTTETMTTDAWVETHIIKSIDVTRRLLEEVGRWNDVRLVRRTGRHLGGTLNAWYYLVSNEQGKNFQVVVREDEHLKPWLDTVTELNMEVEKCKRKTHADRCGELSRKYHVPFEMALKIFGTTEWYYQEYRASLDRALEVIQKMDSPEFIEEAEKLPHYPYKEDERERVLSQLPKKYAQQSAYFYHELCCGRARKEKIFNFFGIFFVGDLNHWDLSQLMEPIEKALEKAEEKEEEEKRAQKERREKYRKPHRVRIADFFK